MLFVVSSRTDLDDDFVDVASFSALDVAAQQKNMLFVVVLVVGARRGSINVSQDQAQETRNVSQDRANKRVPRPSHKHHPIEQVL